MTVNEIVSFIRGQLKQTDRSKGIYTDKYLWEAFTIARAEVLSNFRLRRFNYKNPQNYTTICLELEEAKSHVCGCIKRGCDVLVTKYKLPKFFSGRNMGTIRFLDLNNRTIDLVDESEVDDVYAYNDIYTDQIMASIVNEKVVIWNTLDLKGLQARALWEDVTTLDSIQWCQDTGGETACIDVYNTDIGVDKDLVLECLRRIREIVDLPLRLHEDTTNNSNSEE